MPGDEVRDQEPLLRLDAARIEAGGALGEPLDARGGKRRVALLGGFRPLFRLLAGEALLATGDARLAGVPAAQAVRDGVAGLALADPALVPEWTAERYLLESARLLGFKERDARHEADAALADLGVAAPSRRRLRDLLPVERRLLLLAHAALGGPRVVCAETPLAALDEAAQAIVEAALERAAEDRRLLISISSFEPRGAERALVLRSDWVIVEHAGRVIREGPPSIALTPARHCVATVTRRGAEFLAELAARGLTATPGRTRFGFAPPYVPEGAEPLEVVVELAGDATPNDVRLAAERAGAPLVELEAGS